MRGIMDYGRPMEPFFINLGQLGYLQPIYQHPFLYNESLVNVFFFINQPLFLQKTKPLYPNPKYLFEIGILIWAPKN